MMTTEWSDQRLRKLYERYNRIYWRGSLPRYHVVLSALSHEGSLGRCDLRKRVIRIDPGHQSDRALRGTLLHEMAHAATKCGHTVPFFAELERLMRRGAPVEVGAAEAGEARILADIVPRRFRLLRSKMDRIENRRRKQILKMAGKTRVKFQVVTDEEIVRDFVNVAPRMPWKTALVHVGLHHGLTDEGGRPKNAWASRLVTKAKKAHSRARRDHLACERLFGNEELSFRGHIQPFLIGFVRGR